MYSRKANRGSVSSYDLFGQSSLHGSTWYGALPASILGKILYALFMVAFLMLLCAQVASFMVKSRELVQEIGVDGGLSSNHIMDIGLTFLRIPCDEAAIDVSDVMGTLKLDVHEGITKIKLMDGVEVGPWVEKKDDGESADDLGGECQPCPGVNLTRCCNSCRELRDAFSKEGIAREEARKHPQCLEGCRLRIQSVVRPCSGSIRFVPGQSRMEGPGETVYHIDTQDLEEYGLDLSHHIHHIQFLPETSARVSDSATPVETPDLHMPLDGRKVIMKEEGTASKFEYEVQFVPTTLISPNPNGDTIHSHQYTVEYLERPMLVPQGTDGPSGPKMQLVGAPGFFLNYRFQPFRIQKHQRGGTWGELLPSMLFLVGGVAALAELCHAVVNKLVKRKHF